MPEITMSEHFRILLAHIESGRNDEANAILNENLARAFDDSDFYEALLQHAAEHNNAVIARKLIELGADVDGFGNNSNTPLGIAVLCKYAAVVQVLLEAGARIDMVDDNGCSVLQLALDLDHVDSEIFELFVRKLRNKARTNDAVAEMLIRAGCNMYHAATLRDVNLMECMLRHGIDVNSRAHRGVTALHVAVLLNDAKMVEWLMKKGIDVDALDQYDMSALGNAVEETNMDMVKFLLERGVHPDLREGSHGRACLYAAFSGLCEGPDEPVECAELLLQHGASFPDSKDLLRMFEIALHYSCDKAVKLLIAHMALLAMLDKPVDMSVVESVNERRRTKMSELRKYYEPCQQVLKIKVFGKFSLLNMLNESDGKLKLLVRNETFLQEVEKVSSEHKLSESYSYYYNTMIRRIEKASRAVKLEDEAILVICKIFEADESQFYYFARGVVEYLNESDLENLVKLYLV